MIKIDSNRHYVHRPANKMVSIFRYSGAPDLARFEEAIGLGMSKHEYYVPNCTEKVTRQRITRSVKIVNLW